MNKKATHEEVSVELDINIASPIITGITTDLPLLQKYCRKNYEAAQLAVAKLIRTRQKLRAVRGILEEAKREHYHCDDAWYCCGACTHEDHGPLSSHEGEARRTEGVCNCGAEAWNKKIDEVLKS